MLKEEVLHLFNFERNEEPGEELEIIIDSIVHFSECEKKYAYYEGLKAGHSMAYDVIMKDIEHRKEIMQ